MNNQNDKHSETIDIVREQYGKTAKQGFSTSDAAIASVAKAFGYSAEELASIPQEANMGLSCGNPIATANLNKGEVVVDLGSGGGLDVFLAAEKIGAEGRAIGIDMTPEMIELARKNAQKGPGGEPYANVEFKLGKIDDLPLDDNLADVIISNCVINLAPDKEAVFSEMIRVLKPGGRVAISDIALKQTLPEELANSVTALVGCIAGAVKIESYKTMMEKAGFEGVTVIDSGADLMAYSTSEQHSCCSTTSESSCCSSAKPSHLGLEDLLSRYNINEYAASVKVFAIKPKC